MWPRRRQIARAGALVAFALLAACSKRTPERHTPSPAPTPAAITGADVAAPWPVARADARARGASARDAGALPAAPGDDDAYLASSPRSGRSIGHTSVVFKLALTSGKTAAFKPASRRGPQRYKGEIAAYRLGRALGLPNVPRALFRVFASRELAGALASNAKASALFAREAISRAGAVRGAIIPWIDHLTFLPLEREPMRSRSRRWLRAGAPIPQDKRALARQLSTLIAFDFLTANWDRWSGANIGFDEETGLLLFVDNDGAFFEPPPKEASARQRRLLERVDRFSRSFVEHLRALGDAELDRAIGDEAPGRPLLAPKVLAALHERRRELLAVVDAKMDDAGDSVLAFP